MRLPNSILAFTVDSEERQNAYSKFVEYYESYINGKTNSANGTTFEEMNSKMLQFFKDEVERMSGRKIADYNDLATFCNFSDVRESAFAIIGMITDLIIPDALFKDFGAIAEIKNGAWGDTLKVDIKPRDLFIVAKGGRARRDFDVTRQYNGEKTVVPEVHAVTVGISLYDVLRGAYTLAEFVRKAVQSIEVQMRYDIYDAFAAAMDALPDSGDTQLKLTGWNGDSAIALAQKVSAWNGGATPIFLGTKLALSKILPASTNTRIHLGDEYVRIGYLREYFGVTCVELEQIADYKKEFAVKLDNDKIYVLCPGTDKIVKVFIEGSTLAHNETDFANANLQQVATLHKSYGVGAFTSAIAGVIKLS